MRGSRHLLGFDHHKLSITHKPSLTTNALIIHYSNNTQRKSSHAVLHVRTSETGREQRSVLIWLLPFRFRSKPPVALFLVMPRVYKRFGLVSMMYLASIRHR